MGLKVMVVEDVPELRRAIERHLRHRGAEVIATESVEVAVDLLTREPGGYHLLLLDLHLPDGCGLEVLSRLPRGAKKPWTIVMTGDASVDRAVEAMRLGVKDFFVKPLSMGALDGVLASVAESRLSSRAQADAAAEATEAWRQRHAPTILGRAPALMQALDMMRRVADTDCPVLVNGETGTGKELVARALHAGSSRARRPFVALNCAAIPEHLVESELFGHSRGAFTGAASVRTGRFVEAHGGTLFLDEIGEMPLLLQAKLLRALQEKEITPLGESKAISVDVRIVAATNRDLEDLVREKRFREDLLYRLDVVRVQLPPLRERKGDIALLAATLVERVSRMRGCDVSAIEAGAMELLESYPWPGNVRQLANVVERMVILRNDGPLTTADLPERVRSHPRRATNLLAEPDLPEEGLDLRASVERFESALMRQALDRTSWNKNRAAAILKLNRTTLVEKLKKRGWTSDDEVAVDALTAGLD